MDRMDKKGGMVMGTHEEVISIEKLSDQIQIDARGQISGYIAVIQP